MVIITDRTGVGTVGGVKAVVVGTVGLGGSHVPFAGEVGLVTVGFEKSGEVKGAVGEDRLIAGGESGIAKAAGVTTSEGGDARGCALGH